MNKSLTKYLSLLMGLWFASAAAWPCWSLALEDAMVDSAKAKVQDFSNDQTERLMAKLNSALEGRSYWLNLDFGLQVQQILSSIQVQDRVESEEVQSMPLPGIVKSSGESREDSQIALKRLDRLDLFSLVRIVKVKLTVDDDKIAKEDQAISGLISEHFANLSGKRVSIDLKIDVLKPLGKFSLRDENGNLTQKEADGASDTVRESGRERTEIVDLAVRGMLLLVAFGIVLALWLLARRVSSVADKVVASIRSSAELLGETSVGTPATQLVPADVPRDVPDRKVASGAVEAELRKIQVMIDRNPGSVGYVVSYLLKNSQFELLFFLLGATDQANRESILAKQPRKLLQGFDIFVRENAVASVASEGKMIAALQDVFRLLWLAAQDRSSLVRMALQDSLAAISDEQLAGFISECNAAEQITVVKLTPAARLAHIASTDASLLNRVRLDESQGRMGDDDLERLHEKVLQSIDRNDVVDSERQHLVDLVAHLPQNLEVVFLERFGLDPSFTLEHYASTQLDSIVAWVSNLDVNEVVQVLSLFAEGLRISVVDKLPEIKRRRIASKELLVTTNSYKLKADLLRFLRDKSDDGSRNNLELMSAKNVA